VYVRINTCTFYINLYNANSETITINIHVQNMHKYKQQELIGLKYRKDWNC